MGRRLARKILLVGWDAADWRIATPLLDRGQMPHLARFVEQGVMGDLASRRGHVPQEGLGITLRHETLGLLEENREPAFTGVEQRTKGLFTRARSVEHHDRLSTRTSRMISLA